MPRLSRLAPALALALVACLASTPAPIPTPSPPASTLAGLVLRQVEAQPIERSEAAIAAAFDREGAAELVEGLADDIDFATQALVCVYLGERSTTGWGLDLQSAALVDGELRISARETRPRGGGGERRVTFPADCGLLNRDGLPPGELPVRADDTISDEFIVGGALIVPEAAGAP